MRHLVSTFLAVVALVGSSLLAAAQGLSIVAHGAGIVDQQPVLLPIYNGESKLWGYQGVDGKWVIPPSYARRAYFHDGVAIVEQEDKLWIIDTSGQQLARYHGSFPTRFSEGLAAAKRGRRWGYVDKQGEWAIVPQFSECHPFRNGLAFAKSLRSGDRRWPWGVIDVHGNWVVRPQFLEVPFGFDEDRAAVRVTGKQPRWVIIDSAGRRVSDRVFANRPGRFDSGLALVELAEGGRAYIASTGENANFDVKRFVAVDDFREGLAVAIADAELRPLWGYVNPEGEWVIPPQWLEARPFNGGLAVVRSGPMWGLIDREGKQVAPQVYSHIEVWETGGFASLGFAPAKREDGARGYVTVEGRFVLDGQSEEEWRTPLRWDVHFGQSRDELLAILQGDKIEESRLKPGEPTVAMFTPHDKLPRGRREEDVLEIRAESPDSIEYYWLIEDESGTRRVFWSLSMDPGIRF